MCEHILCKDKLPETVDRVLIWTKPTPYTSMLPDIAFLSMDAGGELWWVGSIGKFTLDQVSHWTILEPPKGDYES